MVEKEFIMEQWQKEQLKVATGVTKPDETHSTVYISIIEELETENRMLRARNERLTMAMKKMERILQENLR
jgi:predicted transcriptional regulator